MHVLMKNELPFLGGALVALTDVHLALYCVSHTKLAGIVPKAPC